MRKSFQHNVPSNFLRWGLVFLFARCCLQAETFCALNVEILTAEGQPARSTWVQLLNPEGVVLEKKYVSGSRVSFCDFGLGTHSVKIAVNECYPITVSNLKLELGHPISLTLRKNRCPGEAEHTGCKVYFRIHNGNGIPLVGVEVRSLADSLTGTTDEYGRFEAYFKAGDHRFQLSKPPFDPLSLSISCPEGGEALRDLILTAK